MKHLEWKCCAIVAMYEIVFWDLRNVPFIKFCYWFTALNNFSRVLEIFQCSVWNFVIVPTFWNVFPDTTNYRIFQCFEFFPCHDNISVFSIFQHPINVQWLQCFSIKYNKWSNILIFFPAVVKNIFSCPYFFGWSCNKFESNGRISTCIN